MAPSQHAQSLSTKPEMRRQTAATTFSRATIGNTTSRPSLQSANTHHNRSLRPTVKPTLAPRKVTIRPERTTQSPIDLPTFSPFLLPPRKPSLNRTKTTLNTPPPTRRVTTKPSIVASVKPSPQLAVKPTAPSLRPTTGPAQFAAPLNVPSDSPSSFPSDMPSKGPSISPSDTPSFAPSRDPSGSPSFVPSSIPSSSPTVTMTTVPQEELVMDFEGLPLFSSFHDHNQSIAIWENITSQHVLQYWQSLPIPHVVVTIVNTEFQSQVTRPASSSSTHYQLFADTSVTTTATTTTTTRVTYSQTITYGLLPPQLPNINTDALFTRPFTLSSQEYANALIRAFNASADIVLDNFYFGLPTLSPSPAPPPTIPHTRKLNNGWIAIIVVGSIVLLVMSMVGIWLGWQKGHRLVAPPPPPPPPTPDMSRTYPETAAAAALYHEEIPSRLYSNVECRDYAYSQTGSMKDIYLERSPSDLLGEEQPPHSQSNLGITASVSTTSSSVFREPSVAGGGSGGDVVGSTSFGTDGGMVTRASSDNLQGMAQSDAAAAMAMADTSTNGEEGGMHHRPRLASADFMDSSYRSHADVSNYRRVHSSGDLGEDAGYLRPSDFGGGENITDQTGSGSGGGVMSNFSPMPTAFPLLANIEEVDYDLTSPSATNMTMELPGDEVPFHGESQVAAHPEGGVLSDDEENHIFSMTGFNLQILDLDDM